MANEKKVLLFQKKNSMATTVDEVWKNMSTKKIIKICLIIPVILLFLSLFYLIMIYPIATTVELSIFTKNFPRNRTSKFILSTIIDDSSHGWEWGTFELDKKCFDLNYDTDYWTIRGHDDLVFYVSKTMERCDIAEIISSECVLPTEINTDAFKAIGISKYNSFFNILDNDYTSLSFNPNDTVMLDLSSEEVGEILNIICLKNFNDIFYEAEFSPQKNYYFHLYMDENDNIFRFAPDFVTLAFDGEQWKLVSGRSKDGLYYVADVPFDTSMLSGCE